MGGRKNGTEVKDKFLEGIVVTDHESRIKIEEQRWMGGGGGRCLKGAIWRWWWTTNMEVDLGANSIESCQKHILSSTIHQ